MYLIFRNITFTEVLRVIYNESILATISVEPEGFHARSVFVAKFGFCLEITNYDQDYIEIYLKGTKELRLFFTDKTKRSFFMPDISSHRGGKIVIEPHKITNIDVHVKKTSTCSIEKPEQEADSFQECVEKEIANKVGKSLGCIPPWLSEDKQCNSTYSTNFLDKIDNFIDIFLWPVYTFANSKLESGCKTNCMATNYLVIEGESMQDDTWGAAFISFDQHVYVTEKLANYSLFEFIVDVGSSLGLWLGLSVLGLYDLAKTVVEFIMTSNIFTKLESALKK